MNQKGFAPILIILSIVLLLGVAGGAYWLGTIKNSKPDSAPAIVSNQNNPQPTINSQVTTAPVNDETANWKIYTNNQLGISFKYPPSFILTEESQSILLISDAIIANKYVESLKDKPVDLSFNPVGFIRIGYGPTSETIDDLISTMKTPVSIKPITVDNKSGKELSYYWEIGRDNAIIQKSQDLTYQALVGSGKNMLMINEYWGKGYEKSSSMEKIYRQILSTFKFL